MAIQKKTSIRRKFAAACFLGGALMMLFGLLTPGIASAAAGPAVFGSGYDSYLNDNQRGVSSADVQSTNCPTDAKVSGMTAWHFVMSANTADFASLDVAFTVNGSSFTLTGLTPKTTADWATFDPTKNFIADPSLKHAYVYTNGAGGTVRDAASQDDPDGTGPKFQLSHVCVGDGTTTTTAATTSTTGATTSTTEATTSTTEATTSTTEATTSTTEATTSTTEATTSTTEATTSTTEATTSTTLGTTTTQPSTTTTGGEILGSSTTAPSTTAATKTSETVLGEVITAPAELPKTGSNATLPLVILGAGFILLGAGTLVLSRRGALS